LFGLKGSGKGKKGSKRRWKMRLFEIREREWKMRGNKFKVCCRFDQYEIKN